MRDVVSKNIVEAKSLISPTDRETNLGMRGKTVWFTGLSGSGKSTLAYALEKHLVEAGTAAYVLDGDNLRFGLNSDLGFSPQDRAENIRRVGELARLMCSAGMVVLCSFVSPYRKDRERVREIHEQDPHLGQGTFCEVHVSTPLAVCEQRDIKGLYAKARAGEITGFTGIDAPFEAPLAPEYVIDTTQPIQECVAELTSKLGLQAV